MAKPISEDKRTLILEGNLMYAILILAVPVMINSFIQSMYNLTDTFWLGKIGTDSQAAITLVSPVQNILINFGMGITTAGSILISQYLGARQDEQAKNMANHICVCSILFSFACAGICWLASPGIIGWLGAEGTIYTYGLSYIRIVVLDLPFLFMINMYTSVHQSQGDTFKPMLLNLLGVSVNLILDPLFLIVFKWGIAGAAFATLLAKIPSAVIAVISLCNKKNLIHIYFKGFKFEKAKMLSIIKIGLPTAIGGSTMQFGFLLMTKNVNAYGTTATTAYGIGNKINSIITLPANGIGSAISTIVGQNIGAGNIKRVSKTFHFALRLGAVFLFVFGTTLSLRFIAEPIVRFFTTDESVVPLATDFLSLMAMWCWTNAFYNVTQGLFQGCGHTMITMLIDAIRIWGFRFLTLWFCSAILNMGVESVWYSVVVSNGLSALCLYLLYWTGIWKKQTVKINGTQKQQPINEQTIHGDVKIQFRDIETKDTKPQGGASFKNAAFAITSLNAKPILVEGKQFTKGQLVKVILSAENGIAATSKGCLPNGHYRLDEVIPPDGYLRDGVISCEFDIVKNGEIVDLTAADQCIYNQIKRGDLEGIIIKSGTYERLADVPFKITSKTTGESHMIITDQNGQFSTASDWISHCQNTNAGVSSEDGIWFGISKPNDSKGALPYDTYEIRELRCNANKKSNLIPAFHVAVSKDKTVINLGTLIDEYETLDITELPDTNQQI